MENKVQSYKTTFRLITLLVGSTLVVMAGAVITPTLPQMKLAFKDVSDADFLVKLVLTLPALSIALVSPFCGILLDRWGRKPVLIIAVILYGISGSSGYVLDSIYAILVGRAILGVAVAGTITACTTLIADYFMGSKLSKIMGLQAVFMGFAGVLFLVVGGVLTDIGWRFPYLIYLSAFPILIGILLFIYEPNIQRNSETSPNLKETLQIKSLIYIYILAFFGMAIFYMVPLHLPFYLPTIQKVNNTQIGIAIAVMTLFSAFGSMQYQKVKKRFSFQTIFSMITILLGLGYLILAIATNYYHVIIGLLVSGVGMGFFYPNIILWLVSLVQQEVRGRAVGGLTTALFLGAFFSPIMTKPIIQQIELSGSYALVGGVILIISIVYVGVRLVGSRTVDA